MRKKWSDKYRISDATIFDLFSEFSSMMMIGKAIDSGNMCEIRQNSNEFSRQMEEAKMLEVLPSSDKKGIRDLIGVQEK